MPIRFWWYEIIIICIVLLSLFSMMRIWQSHKLAPYFTEVRCASAIQLLSTYYWFLDISHLLIERKNQPYKSLDQQTSKILLYKTQLKSKKTDHHKCTKKSNTIDSKKKTKWANNILPNNCWYLITSIAGPSSSFIKLHLINTIRSRISRCNSYCLVQFIYLPVRKLSVLEICKWENSRCKCMHMWTRQAKNNTIMVTVLIIIICDAIWLPLRCITEFNIYSSWQNLVIIVARKERCLRKPYKVE